MADPNTYPKQNVYPQQTGLSAQPEVEVLALTPEETAELDALYAKLKPEATQEARDYVLTRTPPAWQVDMTAKIDADWPLPPAADPASRLGSQQRRDANPNVDPNLPPYAAGQAFDPRVPR